MKWLMLPILLLSACSDVVHGDRHEAAQFVELAVFALQSTGTSSRKIYASDDVLAMALLQRPCMVGTFKVSYIDELFDEFMFKVSFPESQVKLSFFVYQEWPWSGYKVTGVEFAGQNEFDRQAFRKCLGEDRYLDWKNRSLEEYVRGST